MPRIKKNRFDEMNEQLAAAEVRETPVAAEESKRRATPVLDQRQNIVASLRGKSRTVKQVDWDPKRIRLWDGHNRDYSLLSEERCQDLIDGFNRAGQQFPAVVRKVNDSDMYDYEIICGARRHWTATHLKRDLLIEVRQLDDKEAFLLQDIENRDREDISDYERACDYAKALPTYFNGKMTAMAEQLQINKGNFSRFLALAQLPIEIVEAYGDIRELHANHMSTYNKLLKDAASKKKVIAAAKKLKGQGVAGKEVLKQLGQATQQSKVAAKTTSKADKKDTPKTWTRGGVSLTKAKSGQFTASFSLPESGSTEQGRAVLEVRRDLIQLLDELVPSADGEVGRGVGSDIGSGVIGEGDALNVATTNKMEEPA